MCKKLDKQEKKIMNVALKNAVNGFKKEILDPCKNKK